MDAKEYLQQIYRLDRIIQSKFAELEQLKIMSQGLSAINNGERVQTSGDKDKIGCSVSKIVDMENEINYRIDTLKANRKIITEQIENMENTNHMYILFNRYVAYKDWGQIAVELHYSYRQVTKEHGKAIKDFEEKYKATFKKLS